MHRHMKHRHRHGRNEQNRYARMGFRRPKHNIPVNIIEHEAEFVLSLHAPSFPRDQIKVTVVEDTLYISGTREIEGDTHPNFLLQEYPIKSFERSFELSHRADKKSIKATYKDGILTVKVAKTVSAQHPEVDITVE